jgi:hypothetical protein
VIWLYIAALCAGAGCRLFPGQVAVLVALLMRLASHLPAVGRVFAPHRGRHTAAYLTTHDEMDDTQALAVPREVAA